MSHQGEERDLQLHKNILKDIIFEQAGTRQKAVLEGVMNSVDAGATRITITLDEKQLVIEDDGCGFATKEEIERHFDTFGTPHKEGDAKFGRFRMGRGQLFAKGKNTWRSQVFEMKVDAKAALKRYLRTDLPIHQGCRVEVEWYDRLGTSERLEITREIERMVKYLDVPVFVNEKQVSNPPKDEKWDLETDDAYFRFRQSGTLTTYNMGVFVGDMASAVHGIGGIIVSKHRLMVNFARNEVMSECKVWQRIKRVVRKQSNDNIREKTRRKAPLNDAERERVALAILAGEYEGNVRAAKVFTDVTGRHWSLAGLQKWMYDNEASVICVAPKQNDQRGDILMQQQRAFVFGPATLDRFGVRKLKDLYEPFPDFENIQERAYSKLAKTINTRFIIIPESNWTPSEKVVIEAIRLTEDSFRRGLGQDGWEEPEDRKLCIGESEAADAWTDGQTFVALERGLFRDAQDMDLRHWSKIGRTLLHEYCHDDDTMAGHVHGPDFYKRYHDSDKVLDHWLHEVVYRYVAVLEKAGKRLKRDTERLANRLDAIKDAEPVVRLGAKAAAIAANAR